MDKLRIWGSGVRISSGAPVISVCYARAHRSKEKLFRTVVSGSDMLRAPIESFALVAERPRSLELRPNRTSMEITIQCSASLQALAGIRVEEVRLGGVERELYGVAFVDSHPLLQHRHDFSLARMRDQMRLRARRLDKGDNDRDSVPLPDQIDRLRADAEQDLASRPCCWR